MIDLPHTPPGALIVVVNAMSAWLDTNPSHELAAAVEDLIVGLAGEHYRRTRDWLPFLKEHPELAFGDDGGVR